MKIVNRKQKKTKIYVLQNEAKKARLLAAGQFLQNT